MRSSMIKLVLLSLLIGATKAAHFRMMMFGLLGLAGLWMMNNVARASSGATSEDRGQGLFPNFSVASLANRFLTKRSVGNPVNININWEAVLENDLSTCTRSYVCQIVAAEEADLHPEEAIMLNIIKQSKEVESSNWATKQIHLAARSGEKWRNKSVCMKIYKRCPYTSATMRQLLSTLNVDSRK